MTDKFKQRIIKLIGEPQRATAQSMIANLPLGMNIEIVARETPKARGQDANSAMWAGILKDIAEQVWLNNRQYSTEIWHEYFKAEYLPELDDAELERLVKDPLNYKKWDYNPKGERILIGSSTQLTPYGFKQYTLQIEAFGGNNGVLFSANPRYNA